MTTNTTMTDADFADEMLLEEPPYDENYDRYDADPDDLSPEQLDALDASLNRSCRWCGGTGETQEADVDEQLYRETGILRGHVYTDLCYDCGGSGVEVPQEPAEAPF